MVVGLDLTRIEARFQLSDATRRVLVAKRWRNDMVTNSIDSMENTSMEGA